MAGESIKRELEAYRKMRSKLNEHHKGKFVLIYGDDFIDAYDTFDRAAEVAVDRFGEGPFLIRLVGEEKPMPLPASVAYHPAHADN